MTCMDRPSVTEMERGGVHEMEIEISSIHFFDTWFVHPFHIEKYGRSQFKSAFGIKFGLREVVKLKIRKYPYLHNFQFDHFLKSKIYSKCRFEMRISIFLIQNFVFEEFWSI